MRSADGLVCSVQVFTILYADSVQLAVSLGLMLILDKVSKTMSSAKRIFTTKQRQNVECKNDHQPRLTSIQYITKPVQIRALAQNQGLCEQHTLI